MKKFIYSASLGLFLLMAITLPPSVLKALASIMGGIMAVGTMRVWLSDVAEH